MSDDKLLISQLEDLLDSGRLPTLEPGGEVTLSKEDLPEEQCPDSPAIEFENANNRISKLESENAELRKVLAWYGDREKWVRDCWVDAETPAEIPSTRIRFNEDHEVALLSRFTGINMKNRKIKYTGFGPAMDFGQRAREAQRQGGK